MHRDLAALGLDGCRLAEHDRWEDGSFVASALLAFLFRSAQKRSCFAATCSSSWRRGFRSPLVWMVVPSASFALGHYMPDTAGENALILAVWAGFLGLLMADLTARAGTLGPAIAVHFWNNASAMLLVSLPDELSGLALYLAAICLQMRAMRGWLPVDLR